MSTVSTPTTATPWYRAALLHKSLDVLGLPVAREEVAARIIGPDTREKLRVLRVRVFPPGAPRIATARTRAPSNSPNLPATGTTERRDRTTASAVATELSRMGLTATSRAFVVSGTVRALDGRPMPRTRLLAFDLDLRGVVAYPKVSMLAQVLRNSGFEILGEAVADRLGAYSLTFYDWQYRRAERKKADVVVFAVESTAKGERIIGRSRIVAADDYSDSGQVQGLDIELSVANDETEYQALLDSVEGFTKDSGTSFQSIATSEEQLAFTARELDLDLEHLVIAARAQVLLGDDRRTNEHELLYGIGRQHVALTWQALSRTRAESLVATILSSVEARIIRAVSRKDVTQFVAALKKRSVVGVLDQKTPRGDATVDEALSTALPERIHREAFIAATHAYKGSDSRTFWTTFLPEQPAFKQRPELVARLLVGHQLAILSGGHQPLVKELLTKGVSSIDALFILEHRDWLTAIRNAGVPGGVPGSVSESEAEHYVAGVLAQLDSAFPTKRIASMLQKGQLKIERTSVADGVEGFLVANGAFDFATSRVADFTTEVAAAAGPDALEVTSELKRLQRVFQVSSSPSTMSSLLELGLHSANAISSIPRQNFIQQYAAVLGGELEALQVHQRAAHIAARAELGAVHLMEYSHAMAPAFAMGDADRDAAMAMLRKVLPSYADLLGSADVCECKECRSVYGPAAYLVEVLRFLHRGGRNADDKSPLDVLRTRRPDLTTLPLTCENGSTFVPYIDLANEVMEYYTATDSIAGFTGFDTGEATAEELRANPQNANLIAYRILKDATYPFTLPYHKPLDVLRTFGDHLSVRRHDVMRAANPQPEVVAARAIAAESLSLCQEEYALLTGANFDGSLSTIATHQCFGYAATAQLEQLADVPELLRRTGLKYAELVELVKTRFINPSIDTLELFQRMLADAPVGASVLYARMVQIAAATLDPATDAAITQALTGYNNRMGTSITPAEFGAQVVDRFAGFRDLITFYESGSACDLADTRLRTMESIYAPLPTSGVGEARWSRLHRLIRLWRKLGWTIRETDLMLTALGESDITEGTIERLEAVLALKTASRLPVDQLSTFWGNIDTQGNRSLYRTLFLNKAVQPIDAAFQPDPWGEFLKAGDPLDAHRAGILAAFRLRDADLTSIYGVANVGTLAGPRRLDPAADALNVANLSTIYRYTVLARGLKMRVPDLCDLIALFGAAPFSTWDMDQKRFVAVDPAASRAFFELATAVKASGFKAAALEYIIRGTISSSTTLGLKREKVLQVARGAGDAFAAIDAMHPDVVAAPVTAEMLTAKLTLTVQADVVARFMAILDGRASFDVVSLKNLALDLPVPLSARYSYTRGSGRLTVMGAMTAGERSILEGLVPGNVAFQGDVRALYEAPEHFIAENFGGIFANLAEAMVVLLDRPEQLDPTTVDERYAFVYRAFVPVLRARLRRDAVTQQVAALIGLDEATTAVVIEDDIEALTSALSERGFWSTYYLDPDWTAEAMSRVDEAVDFDWGNEAPDASVPAEGFSVRWEAYLTPPASGEYTFFVDVAEADEAFALYLDDTLLVEKAAGDASLSKEVVASLNTGQMPRLRLDYAETTQNAGVRLRWKSATGAPSVLPAASSRPAAAVDGFVAATVRYHRAATFITGFGLHAAEVDRFIRSSAAFEGIDFKALTATHWQRVNAYRTLRDVLPQTHARLTDLFAAAAATTPPATLAEIDALLIGVTGWDAAGLTYLRQTHFALDVGDFTNETALTRLSAMMQLATRAGVSAETVAVWGEAETAFAALSEVAQTVKSAVRARYDEQGWLGVAAGMSNRLRDHQKEALAAYLLTRPAIQEWGAADADGLFEYFLIDVQMGTCMDTSRIVQAHAAVQLFVNRCLLNEESETSTGVERGVSPHAIDRERWAALSQFQVWRASREVFLYPENNLEPEWRTDRSAFFKELEAYLVQNDITDRTVEQGLRGYLASLGEVSNLDVCGMCRESYEKGAMKFLHVFGRTHSAPYKYFYRRWNEFGRWSAWERVPVDIRPVETMDVAGSENSGVQLVPVVWKGRLFLFTPEFAHAQEPTYNPDQTVEGSAGTKLSQLKARDVLQTRLAWSEYVDGRWTPKRVSKEYVSQKSTVQPAREGDYLFTPTIDLTSQELTIWISDTWQSGGGSFVLADIESPIRVVEPGLMVVIVSEYHGSDGAPSPSPYTYDFAKRRSDGPLRLQDDDYLTVHRRHKVLPLVTVSGRDISLADPFFFSDAERTYFVRPVEATVTEAVQNPTIIPPALIAAGIDASALVQSWALGGSNGNGNGNGANAGAVVATNTTSSKRYLSEVPRTTSAFGGIALTTRPATHLESRIDTGLEFHTFHHPLTSAFVTRLNQHGIAGLMASDTEIVSDEGAHFEARYAPDLASGLVQKPADFPLRTYYKDNFCVDPRGANKSFNEELTLFVPLYIASRLSANGRYEEAVRWFQFIFDPMSDEMPVAGDPETSRYWKYLPFRTTPAESIEEWLRTLVPSPDPLAPENDVIKAWREHPFEPHVIAANRPLAYMKHVVMKYVENLLAWGDAEFRLFTRESVNKALNLYVMANHILGPRPERIPPRGELKAESYASLEARWDDFSNALVELENIFPFSSEASVVAPSTGSSLLGVGSAFYFGIPANDKLMRLWDRAADRLFKIRHCQDIDGVQRSLALFAPRIDPAVLVQATALGMSLGSILADLGSPPPLYRFTVLLQKANEFCADVRGLGAALLATLEKKDAEELGRLRASHESQMLDLMTSIRERQVLDARTTREGFERSRVSAAFRVKHYQELLGNDGPAVPDAPTLGAELTAESQLPADTAIGVIKTNVDESLVDGGGSGIKLIPKEKHELEKVDDARKWQIAAQSTELLAAVAHAIPTVTIDGKPFGVGVGSAWGGPHLGNALSATGRVFDFVAGFSTYEASMAARTAGFIRREQEWTLQANLAAMDIIQLDKQITSATIRIQIAEAELANHRQQIENGAAVERFLRDKFTTQELYQWMKEQLQTVYKQSYNLAFDMAKKAEQAYQAEVGAESAGFIQYGYWESTMQGLAAGERLQLALRQLDKAYLEENRRELEITKNVPLSALDPLALVRLRETGECTFRLREELFDLDFRGHYFRRIKSARLTIPCVAGPYTSVNCILRLLDNTIRTSTAMNGDGRYEHENDEGMLMDDSRFRSSYTPVQAIATSTGQNDAGMFEFTFRDERYLPFELAGAISQWQLELSADREFRQIDPSTISDVILQLSYTAREQGGAFAQEAAIATKDFMLNVADRSEQPFTRTFSMRHEFPSEWYRFLNPSAVEGEQVLDFTVGRQRFPFFVQDREVIVSGLELIGRGTAGVSYVASMSSQDANGDEVASQLIVLAPDPAYGELQRARLDVGDSDLLASFDIDQPLRARIKRIAASDFASLQRVPDELQDLTLVFHYRLGALPTS